MQVFRNLASGGVKLPHRVRLKTENDEFSAVIDFLKQYENYIRVEGKFAVSEKQRFELNLLNDQTEAKPILHGLFKCLKFGNLFAMFISDFVHFN